MIRRSNIAQSDSDVKRSLLDAVIAELFEVSTHEYAYVLSTFPLLDRDQPPLPHDYRIRATSKGVEWRKISFITRDLALLTYFDYLAGRLDMKPDAERVRRICPNGVPGPPEDIAEFFAEARCGHQRDDRLRGGRDRTVSQSPPARSQGP